MKSVKLKELLVIVFDFDDLNSGKLYETLENIYDELDDHKLFIMDLSNIRHLSTEAAGSLVFIQSYLNDRKKSLRMYQTKDQVHDVYEKLNLENVMYVAYNTGENETENLVFYIN